MASGFKKNTYGPFYLHGLILILAWINDHMPGTVWFKFIIHSQTSTVPRVKFENGLVISSHFITDVTNDPCRD